MFNKLFKRRPAFSHPDAGGTALGFVLLREASLSPQELLELLQRTFGDKVELSPGSDGDPMATVTTDLGTVFVMTMPAPIPNREAESNAERNPYWPSYEEDLAGYGGHLVVAGMRQRAEGVEPTRADALQVHLAHAEVLNALVDYPGAIGIYSGNQEIAVPAGVYRGLFTEAVDEQDAVPVHNLLNITVAYSSPGSPVLGFVRGLEPFGHADLIVRNTKRSLDEVLDLLTNTAVYLISSDAYLMPGETLGYSEEMRVAISAVTAKDNPFFDDPALELSF